jgi:hypothetical protein
MVIYFSIYLGLTMSWLHTTSLYNPIRAAAALSVRLHFGGAHFGSIEARAVEHAQPGAGFPPAVWKRTWAPLGLPGMAIV